VTPEDAKAVFDLGVDGVMIGRGAIHSPWIFRYMRHYLNTGEHLPEPSLSERIAMCVRHLEDSVAYRGARAVPAFRRHYAGYLKNVPNIANLRKDLMGLLEVAPIVDRLQSFLKEYEADSDCAA